MTVLTRRSALSGAAALGLVTKPVVAFARVERSMPEFSATQAAFERIIVQYTTRGWAARGKAARHEVIVQRDRALRAVLTDARFERWRGVLHMATPQKDGTIDATFGMFGGFRSTPVKADSALGSSLLALKSRAAVLVSGSFVIESDGTLARMSGAGGGVGDYDDADFSSPNFLVNLDNVSPG